MNDSIFYEFIEKVKNFTAVASLIMMILIYNSVNEADRFANIYNIRADSRESHGGNSISYAS